MKLILIRHGMTPANENRLYCGSSDIGLSENGIAQLKRMKEESAYPEPDGMLIVTSGMLRCEETLRILYGDIDHETDADLREMDFGDFELRSYEELKSDPDYMKWLEGDNESNIAPNGESGRSMSERAARALSRLIADDRDALVITHGGVIAAIMALLFPEENKSRYDRQPSFGGGYSVELLSGKPRRYEAIPHNQ